uniref:Reelin domain-containing protein n=1 Tax=Oryzias latipes TaxID=8090 RepID=A0A3P9L4S9_ORYLA
MGGCTLNSKMWVQILVGLNIISKAHGFSGGIFPQSCGSLLPEHDAFRPETSNPPFAVAFEFSRHPGDPVTVVLRSEGSTRFRGFMLDAQNSSSISSSSPVGQFLLLDSDISRLLDCYGSKGTAVSQKNNQAKSQVKVNWTAEGEEKDVIFRATFLERFDRFWDPISVHLPRFTTTMEPSSPEPSSPEPSSPEPTSPELSTKTDVTQTWEPTPKNSSEHTKKVAIILMCLDSIVEEVKMEVFNIQTFLFASKPFNFGLIKMSLLITSSLTFAADVASLVLFRVFPFEVAPVALVSVLVCFTSVELLAAFMPIGPSHELKPIWELVLRGCFALHHIFTTAVIFLGVVRSTDVDRRQNGGRSWTLIVMVAFSVWILLTHIWNLVLCFLKQTILDRNQTDQSKPTRRIRTWSLSATTVALIITSVTLAVGTAAFAIAVIFGIMEEP